MVAAKLQPSKKEHPRRILGSLERKMPMCRMAAIKSKNPVAPAMVLRMMLAMQEGHDNSGFAMVMQDLGGRVRSLQRVPFALHGMHSRRPGPGGRISRRTGLHPQVRLPTGCGRPPRSGLPENAHLCLPELSLSRKYQQPSLGRKEKAAGKYLPRTCGNCSPRPTRDTCIPSGRMC